MDSGVSFSGRRKRGKDHVTILYHSVFCAWWCLQYMILNKYYFHKVMNVRNRAGSGETKRRGKQKRTQKVKETKKNLQHKNLHFHHNSLKKKVSRTCLPSQDFVGKVYWDELAKWPIFAPPGRRICPLSLLLSYPSELDWIASFLSFS